MKKRKIAICHYKVGGTDGVSLEIEKRQRILKQLKQQVKLIAGPNSSGADHTITEMEYTKAEISDFETRLIGGPNSLGAEHVIKELDWSKGEPQVIKENGFSRYRYKNIKLAHCDVKRIINSLADKIKDKLDKIQKKENFDYALIHNIFSFEGNIAASKAFFNWVKEYNIETLATNHDFYWEKNLGKIRSKYLKNYLFKYIPPKDKLIHHVVINSLAQKEMQKRRNLKADILPDVFDFKQKEWKQDSYNRDFLKKFKINQNDLVLLQATRIVPRKRIEIAIDYANELQKKIKKLKKEKIYNGKTINAKSKVVLLLTGYTEKEDKNYLAILKKKAGASQAEIKFISSFISAQRQSKNKEKIYSFWDAYVFADLITYPSFWEGWGNQFIEAIFARKPIVLYEYPVFKTDIKKEGYEFISFGDQNKKTNGLYKLPQKNMKKAIDETMQWLKDKNLESKLNKNFELGKKYHDESILRDFLIKKLKLQ